jgi:hypothetical protein
LAHSELRLAKSTVREAEKQQGAVTKAAKVATRLGCDGPNNLVMQDNVLASELDRHQAPA